MTHSHLKTVPIANEMLFLGTIVVSEHLFVQIAEQVERLNVYVGPFQAALEKTPEVFETIGMHLPINVTFGMVNRLVRKVVVVFESLIRKQRIRINRAL